MDAGLTTSERKTKFDQSRARGRPVSARVLVGRPWNIGVCRAQCRRPALAQIMEIGLARLDSVVELGVAVVAPRDQDIERQTDAQIGAHGGIHADEAELE